MDQLPVTAPVKGEAFGEIAADFQKLILPGRFAIQGQCQAGERVEGVIKERRGEKVSYRHESSELRRSELGVVGRGTGRMRMYARGG